MTEYNLNDSFELLGEWYLPKSPEKKIGGKLLYSPEHTELLLNDTFRPLRGSLRIGDSFHTYPVVYGTSTQGEALTLINAQRLGTAFNFGSGGFKEPERLITSWLFIGAHLPDEHTYREISFRIPGLQIWLSRKLISQSVDKNPMTGLWSLSCHTEQIEREITHLNSIDTDLEWEIRWHSDSDEFSRIAVSISAWLTFRPPSPQNIDWFFEQQSKMAPMLALIAGTPMSPDRITASLENPHQKIQILVSMRDRSYCTYRSLHDFYMTRQSMLVDLETAVNNWLDVYPRLAMPSQLTLSIFASKQLWGHVEFLSLMQALEGFHRGLYDGTYVADDEYKSVRNSLCDAIPSRLAPSHKEALRSRIRYGNQFSLQKRLDSLADLLTKDIRLHILGMSGRIPRAWIDTRNYYTHWDDGLRSKILDGQGMHTANVRMRHLLRALFLQVMGITSETINNALCNASGPSQHLAQLNSLERRDGRPHSTEGVIMTITEFTSPNPEDTIPSDQPIDDDIN